MAIPIPPADTPARKAMLDQGAGYYPGVDQWEHPSKGLPAGKLLVQFDYREAAVIEKANATASVYFTDANTLMKHMTKQDQVQARGLAEALQVAPYRELETGPHLYSQHVAIYKLQRELSAEQVIVAKPAEFGEGSTRNNVHLGEGVGKQYFLDIPRDQLLIGPDPILRLTAVITCVDREHKLGWLQNLENSPASNLEIKEAVAQVFQRQVNQLLRGTPPQQEHGREIVELYRANQQLKGILQPPLEPKQSTGPVPKIRRPGPRF